MKCPITGLECDQPKVIHITDIGEKGKIYCQDICLKCFKYVDQSQDIIDELTEPLEKEEKNEYSITTPEELLSILTNPLELFANQITKKCSKCGMSILEFNKNGKMGCASCYVNFSLEIYPLINMYHGAIENKSKIPKKLSREKETKKSLELKLNKAIKEEKYEEAANIKKQLEQFSDVSKNL